MDTKILVPLDGSPLAEKALDCAEILGSRLPAEIVLFHAVSIPFEARDVIAGPKTDCLIEQLETRAKSYLNQIAGDGLGAVAGVSIVVEHGPAAEAIVDAAADPEIHCIVMATHGFGNAKRWVRGSVAERVLQLSSVPVLMICSAKAGRRPKSDSIRRILVPLDGSSAAEKVLSPVVRIAQALDAAITLLRISIVCTSGEFAGDLMMPLEGTFKTADRIAREYLDSVAEDLRKQGVSVTTKVKVGAVAESILEYTENCQVDLIAMSTHGRTSSGRWSLGSVADRVLRAGCLPVLLVRADTK